GTAVVRDDDARVSHGPLPSLPDTELVRRHAGPEPRPAAGAQHARTLEAVGGSACVRRAPPQATLAQAVDFDLPELRGRRPEVDWLEPPVPGGRDEILPHRPRDENPGVPGRQTVGGAINPKRHVEVTAPEIGAERIQRPLVDYDVDGAVQPLAPRKGAPLCCQ